MREVTKGSISILISYLIGFCICLGYVFFYEKINVLPQFLINMRLLRTFSLFIAFIPALLLHSLLVGYARIFGNSGHNTVLRYSLVLLQYLKDVFIILLLNIIVYFLLQEGAIPYLTQQQSLYRIKTENYYEYIHIAKLALKNQQYAAAKQYAEQALLLWKDSKEASDLFDTIKIKKELNSIASVNYQKKIPEEDTVSFENITAKKALDISRTSLQNNDFYTSYLYALQAVRLTNSIDLSKEAEDIAETAWKNIEKGLSTLKAENDVKLYYAKKQAYEYIRQNNWMQAYYTLVAIQKNINIQLNNKRDPDVDRLKSIAQEKLLEQMFFIDETLLLPLFESARNLEFTIPASSHLLKTNIKLRGLSFISKDGIQSLYGRNCTITHYKADGTIFSQYNCPFVKFIPYKTSDNQYAIKLLLTTIDRNKENTTVLPTLIKGINPTETYGVSISLPISLSILKIIITAAKGEKAMTLLQLYKFCMLTNTYGFHQEIYMCELLFRLTNIFLILIIAIYLLIFAWQFRTPPHRVFQIQWFFIFPLLFYGVWAFIKLSRYILRLIIVFLVDISFLYAVIILFTVSIVLFMIVSFLFVAQRSDN